MPNPEELWLQKFFEDAPARKAYEDLTRGRGGESLRPHIDGALRLFVSNDKRRNWAVPKGMDRRTLRRLPNVLANTAASLRQLHTHAFFFMLGGSRTALLDTAKRLDELAGELQGEIQTVLSMRRGRFKGSEFDFKLRTIVPHLVGLARSMTGTPQFEKFAALFQRVSDLAFERLAVNDRGNREKIPSRDTEISADKLRAMCSREPERKTGRT